MKKEEIIKQIENRKKLCIEFRNEQIEKQIKLNKKPNLDLNNDFVKSEFRKIYEYIIKLDAQINVFNDILSLLKR